MKCPLRRLRPRINEGGEGSLVQGGVGGHVDEARMVVVVVWCVCLALAVCGSE